MMGKKQLFKIIALAAMYFVSAWGASLLGLLEGFGLPIYPAAGVALGGAYLLRSSVMARDFSRRVGVQRMVYELCSSNFRFTHSSDQLCNGSSGSYSGPCRRISI